MSAVTTPILLLSAGLAVFAAGALVGYVARGRANRGELTAAGELVSMLNSAETRDDLAAVGPISGDVPAVTAPPYDWATVASAPLRPLPDAPSGLGRSISPKWDAWRPAAKGRRLP